MICTLSMIAVLWTTKRVCWNCFSLLCI